MSKIEKVYLSRAYATAGELYGILQGKLQVGYLTMRSRKLGGTSEPMAIVYRWTFIVKGERYAIEESLAFEELASIGIVEAFAEHLAARWNYKFEQAMATNRSTVRGLQLTRKRGNPMVEIKAGPELDMAVAEACGVKGWIESLRNEATGYESPERFVLADESETVFWEPSTDLNAAFAAAEKVGSDFYGCVELPPCITLDNRTGWRCTIEESPEGRGSTPALAICAAILGVCFSGL